MTEEHYRSLQKLCRLCGGYRDSGWVCHTADYADKLKEIYNIDVSEDNFDFQPRYMCLSCCKTLSCSKPLTKTYQWKEHVSEKCPVCTLPPATSPVVKRRRSETVSMNEIQIKAKELNEHFVCTLCNGYFVNCTTISECLHSFCKSCIVRHLQSRQSCPTCKLDLKTSTTPFQRVMFDDALQGVLDKLLPAVAKREIQERNKFSADLSAIAANDSPSESDGPPNDGNTWFHKNDIKISISLEPSKKDAPADESVPMKYIRCSMRLKVSHLENYIRNKTVLKDIGLQITCKNKPLDGQLTLENIWLDTWKRKEAPMRLYYCKKAD